MLCFLKINSAKKQFLGKKISLLQWKGFRHLEITKLERKKNFIGTHFRCCLSVIFQKWKWNPCYSDEVNIMDHRNTCTETKEYSASYMLNMLSIYKTKKLLKKLMQTTSTRALNYLLSWFRLFMKKSTANILSTNSRKYSISSLDVIGLKLRS